jgi:hypothetical protein
MKQHGWQAISRKRPKLPVGRQFAKETSEAATVPSDGTWAKFDLCSWVPRMAWPVTNGRNLWAARAAPFMVGLPFGKSLDPVTKTNCEGTGVEPDVKVPVTDALATAEQLTIEKIQAKRH